MLKHFQQGGWLEPKPIFHSLVSSGIWLLIVILSTAAATVGGMIWSLLLGQSGPWIVIAGMGAGGTCLYLVAAGLSARRQWRLPQPKTDNEEVAKLLEQVATLNGQMAAAKNKASRAEDARETAQAAYRNLREEKLSKAAKLAEMKVVIREQLEAVPKAFAVEEISPWADGTNALLSKMQLHRLPHNLHKVHGEEHNKKWHQQNLAFLRGLLVTLAEKDVRH